MVYSNSLEEHMEHLRKVFQVLRENELCVKKEKCTFAQPQVQFLGQTIIQGEIRMDSDKISAIRDWEIPTKVTELRYFLGLANYYRRFILGYSAITAPLTDLLKKNRKANIVADALSHKVVLVAIVSTTSSDIIDAIKQCMQHDPVAKQLLVLASKGKMKKFWVDDGILYTTGIRIYVP
ncbi:uncharacterized mitochondrial protein AtMg00860-like [Lycium barbarum]|uniref:uncharacterized mitochondrial protein AtMg00860-like n=1 Tax=Lycium barbarum TaxID=112863 RepID=UPI00293F5DE7|nr:uncharacterized mitochondrial protein AtMg00860-like [Lycium barbarum]